jgi:hypothetical protein
MPAVGASQYPLAIANSQSPSAVVNVDPATGATGGGNIYNYTPISTAGTTTLHTGGGLFGGIIITGSGTSWTNTVYDIGTATNVISPTGTATAVGQTFGVGGIRNTGTLVVVTTGTPGSLNALWD